MENYSFCLFRIPENGGRVIWEITNSCNYKCKHCIFSSENKKIDGELTTQEVFDTLYSLKSNNYTHIKFTGGEPFIRNDMVEIIKKASELGFVFDVSTNGSLITNDIAKEISNTNIQMMHVSLDGHNQETHEFVRGKNTFYKTLKGIKSLVINNVYVRIGTVIYKGNEDKIEDIIKLAIKLGVNEIIFSFMEAVGRIKNDNNLISIKSIYDVKGEIEHLSKTYSNKIKVNFSFTEHINKCQKGICPGGKKFLFINNLGKISPCTWIIEDNKEYMSELTLKNSTLDEIINSDSICSYLNYIKQNNIIGCPVKRR